MLTKNRHLNVALVLALILVMIVPSINQANAAEAKKLIFGYANKGDIPTLDPALVTDTASSQVTNETHYSLVRGLETDLGKIQPGMAEKWELSKDGLTYTFHIRKGITWVKWDGKQVVQVKDAKGQPMPVTAKDFEYGMKRLAAAATASEYAFVGGSGGAGIKGWDEFNSSKATGADLDKLRSAVGITAKDDNTLEVTITQPRGFALGILTLTNFAAQPQAVIEKNGDKWTEPGTVVSYGPYVVSEWKHDESLTLTKNPFWPGIENSPKPKIDEVTIPFLDEDATWNNYEAGSVDVHLSVPVTELDRIKADATLKKELNIGPGACTYYYGFNVNKKPFDNAHMRRAFSMAVDRQAIIDNVTKGGQEPARWFARPGVVAAPTMKDSPKLGIGYDPEGAKKELKAALDEMKTTVDQLPPITLMANQTTGHVAIAQAIQQMWQDVLGIKVDLQTQEWKVFLKTLQADAPQVWRLGWCQDYADADSYDREVMRSDSQQNYGKFNNPEFDKLVDQAAKETDVAKRVALYRQAEDILVNKDAAIIPIYWYTRVQMTKPYVTRTFSQTGGDERLEKWDINKK